MSNEIKAKTILLKSVEESNVEDVIKIRERAKLNNLELYQVDILWQWFSGSMCAGWLCVSDDMLEQFEEWLDCE